MLSVGYSCVWGVGLSSRRGRNDGIRRRGACSLVHLFLYALAVCLLRRATDWLWVFHNSLAITEKHVHFRDICDVFTHPLFKFTHEHTR